MAIIIYCSSFYYRIEEYKNLKMLRYDYVIALKFLIEKKYVFMKHDLPDSVNLTCALLPNTTHGKWFWKDENGKLQNDPPLPPCAVSLIIIICK